MFRHEEHVKTYGLKCVNCHFEDSCGSCHAADAASAEHEKPVRPARSWRQSHQPCVTCHEQDRCADCHYTDEQSPPPVFSHESTGQVLDEDHASLTCGECHVRLRSRQTMTCGGAECHAVEKAIAFPTHRPGAVVTTQPATAPSSQSIWPATTESAEPSTRPVIRRER